MCGGERIVGQWPQVVGAIPFEPPQPIRVSVTHPVLILRTDGPPVEPEPSRTGGDVPDLSDSDASCYPTLPVAGAWQCPGCGTYYQMSVQSCGCQAHRWTRSSNKFELDR